MGMSTHVIGIKPPDEKWKKMKAIWDACSAAGIEPPGEVVSFFDYTAPDPLGVEVAIEKSRSVKEYTDDMRSGFEVDLKALPEDVTVLRFWNSW